MRHWGWFLFSGGVSVMLGGVAWAQFPLSGLYAMGILLGIRLFLLGLTMVATGSVAREAAKA